MNWDPRNDIKALAILCFDQEIGICPWLSPNEFEHIEFCLKTVEKNHLTMQCLPIYFLIIAIKIDKITFL